MQRVWIVVLSVWAILAIVAVLAWTHRPAPTALPQAAPRTLVLKGAHGKRQLVIVQAPSTGAPHATTSTSGVVR
jgi:hypothetical protein